MQDAGDDFAADEASDVELQGRALSVHFAPISSSLFSVLRMSNIWKAF